ncbi:MAG TPA: hypothetical protein VE981_22705 [Planctomycetota bacterium]|nr:hypothetical protein [Planctomycetota bacterium]
MKRMAIGAVAGLAAWFGSALAAEAQQIQPTGPMSIQAGTTSYTYTANITLPIPMSYKVIINVLKNGVCQCTYTQNVPNPGTNTSYLSQPCPLNFPFGSTDTLTFKAQLLWNRTTTNAPDWNLTVTGTRPPTTSSSAPRNAPPARKPVAVVAPVSGDRRRS